MQQHQLLHLGAASLVIKRTKKKGCMNQASIFKGTNDDVSLISIVVAVVVVFGSRISRGAHSKKDLQRKGDFFILKSWRHSDSINGVIQGTAAPPNE